MKESSVCTSLLTSALDLLIPPRCEVCNTLQEPVICRPCLDKFEPIHEPLCRQCGFPLDPRAQTLGHCVECNDDPPPFDVARAAGIYNGTLRRAIHVFKYGMVRALAEPLGRYVAENIELPFPVDGICPVPLHPARQAMRGFNQSQLLVEIVSRHWQIPVALELLQRTQNTTPQMQLPPAQRRENIKGVFAAAHPVKDQSIALLDDVYTTGSTLRECSRVLRRAGAARILVISLARAVQR